MKVKAHQIYIFSKEVINKYNFILLIRLLIFIIFRHRINLCISNNFIFIIDTHKIVGRLFITAE